MLDILRRRPARRVTILDSEVAPASSPPAIPAIRIALPPPALAQGSSLRPFGTYESQQPPAMPSFAPIGVPRFAPATTRRVKILGIVSFAAVLSVLAGVALLAPSQKEPTMHLVSGKAGVKTTSTGATQRWAANKPVTVVLDGSLDTLGPSARAAVRDAFGTWAASGASVPPLTLDNQTASGRAVRDGVNRVLVAPITVAGHEKDVAATIAYADDRTGAIVEVDMIFNDRYAFAEIDATNESSCQKEYDLQNVATHEAGHFFGLGEDLDDDHATMYLRSATCETHKRALTGNDREAMSGLYPIWGSLAAKTGDAPTGEDDATTDGVKAGCGARVAPVTSTRTDVVLSVFGLAFAAAARRFRGRGSLRAARVRLPAAR